MAISHMNEDTMDDIVLSRAVQHMLQDKATRQRIDDALFKGLNFRVRSEFDLNAMQTHLRIAWHDPHRPEVRRAIDHLLPDDVAKDTGLIALEVNEVVSQIDIRGELYFFRLHNKFPNRVSSVEVHKPDKVTVKFKNGRSVHTTERELGSPDFLATCAMVYDL